MASGDLGNLFYSLSIKDNATGELGKIVKDIEDKIKQGSHNITIGGVTLSAKAAQGLVDQINGEIKKAAGEVTVKAAQNSTLTADIKKAIDDAVNGNGGGISINKVTVDTAGIVGQINAALAAGGVSLGKLNTGTIEADLSNAIRKAVDAAKPTIMQRIREALTSGSKRIKLDVDASAVAKSIADKIAQRGVTLKDFKVNASALQQQIDAALRSKKFHVDIAINKMEIASAVDAALQQAGYKNVLGGYSASDARLDKSAREAQKAEDAHALAQEKLRKAHYDAERAAQRNANAHSRLTRDVSNTTMAVNALGGVVGNVFSVYAVKNFAHEIVNVGGELEKMKLAMGSIMGDTYKADTIFKQVSELSMVSPFDVQDLVTYTKQLNAFGIQYSDLYDTTKRLSDIAAAVGVSFGRIAYEFGQTSARGWLDGRELRMFANSGIPLLQKLSDYYTKTMGKVVSASQVREMVTKREVSFEDVRSVLWELTNEGGQFYQMQEVMAESLSAKWRNLANDWNLMLGSIAESSVGDGLKVIAEALMKVVENWKVVSAAIVPSIAALTLYRTAQALATKSTLTAATAQYTFGEALKMSRRYVGNMALALLKSPWTWWMIGISGVMALLARYNAKLQEAEERTEAVAERANEGFRNIEEFKVSPTFEFEPKNEAEYKQAIKTMTDMVKDYAPDAGDLLKHINGLSTTKEQYDALKGVVVELSEAYKQLINLKGIFENANNITDGIIDDSMLENLKDVEKSYVLVEKAINEAVSANGIKIEEALAKARDASPEFTAAITNADGTLRSTQAQLRTLILDYRELFDTVADGYKTINSNAVNWGWFEGSDPFDKVRPYIKTLDSDVIEAKKDIATFGPALKDAIEDIKRDYPGFALLDEENQQRTVTLGITAWLNDNVTNPFARQLLYNDLVERKIILQPTTADGANQKPTPPKKEPNGDPELDEWKERYNLYKNAYNEYKKWYGLYHNVEKAKAETRKNPLFEQLGDVDPSAIEDNLKTLRDEIKKTTKKRRDFSLQVGAEITTIGFDKTKDELERKVAELKEELDRDVRDWDLFKKMLGAGVSGDVAKRLAYGNHHVFDELAAEWAASLNKQMTEALGKDTFVSFDMTEKEAEEFFGKDGQGHLFELWKQTKERIEKNGIDVINDAVEYDKLFQTVKSQIEQAKEEYAKLGLKFDEDGNVALPILNEDATEEQKKQYDVQMATYKAYLKETRDLERQLEKDRRNGVTTSGGSSTRSQKEAADIAKGLYEQIKGIQVNVDENGNAIDWFNADGLRMTREEVQELYAEYEKFTKMARGKTSALAQLFFDLSDGLKFMRDGNKDEANKYFDRVKEGAAGAVSGVAKIGKELAKAFDSKKYENFFGLVGELADGFQKGGAYGAMAVFAEEWLTGVAKIVGELASNTRAMKALYSEIDELSNMMNLLVDSINDSRSQSDAYDAYESATENLEMQMEALNKAIHHSFRAGDFGKGDGIFGGINKEMLEKLFLKDWGIDWDFFSDATAKELRDFAVSNQAMWAAFMSMLEEMNPDLYKGINEKIDLAGKAEELADTITQRIAGISFDGMRDSFVDSLMDMESTAEDFGNNIGETMMEAIIRNIVLDDEFDEWLDKWIEDYREAVRNNDQDALNRLKRDAIDMQSQKVAERDQAAAALGYTGKGSESGSLSSGIKGVTEETADLLASYINAIRADVAVDRSLMEQMVGVQMPLLTSTAQSQLVQLTMQTEYLRMIQEASADMNMTMRQIDERFGRVVDVDRVRVG